MKKEFEIIINEPEKTESVEETASRYYVEIPFHNFDHIKDTLRYAEGVMEECEKEGVAVNKEVVRKALLFHDAGYQENNKYKGFATREEYSASIAEKELEKAGYSLEFIEDVKKAIMSTLKNGKFSTNEQKLVRMADISNMVGEYEKFLDYNISLKKEIKYTSNENYSWNEWKKATKDNMEFYMNQAETIAVIDSRDENGKTEFYNGFRQNLTRFLSEDENFLQKAQEKFEENYYSK